MEYIWPVVDFSPIPTLNNVAQIVTPPPKEICLAIHCLLGSSASQTTGRGVSIQGLPQDVAASFGAAEPEKTGGFVDTIVTIDPLVRLVLVESAWLYF